MLCLLAYYALDKGSESLTYSEFCLFPPLKMLRNWSILSRAYESAKTNVKIQAEYLWNKPPISVFNVIYLFIYWR